LFTVEANETARERCRKQREGMSMYAIFQSGGRQYRAEPGAVVKLEKLPGEVGGEVSLAEVMLVADEDQVRVGQPVLEEV